MNLTSSLYVGLFFNQLDEEWIHVFILTRFPSSWFKTFQFLLVLAFLTSNDSLTFCLWYCSSNNNVLRFIQLKYPQDSKQFSVVPEISRFLLRLSCWCSMVLVMIFLATPMYSTLQVQSNWHTTANYLEVVLISSYISSFLDYVQEWKRICQVKFYKFFS